MYSYFYALNRVNHRMALLDLLGFDIQYVLQFTHVYIFSGIELVGPSKRIWAGIVISYFYAVGLVILAGLASVLRNWRHLTMACAVPNGLFLLYWW